MARTSDRRRPSRPRLPEPVARVLHALGLPVVGIARYWSAEARSIRTSTAALTVGLTATLIAGTVLVAGREQLAAFPGLIVLIPAAIGMRGSIFGALAARLGTGMLTGQLTFGREGAERAEGGWRATFLGRQVEAVALLTVSTATETGVLAWVVASLVGRDPIPMVDLVAVALVAGVLSSTVLLGVTVLVARTAQRRGWNMDDVGAPVITATGDLISLPALLLAAQLLRLEPAAPIVGGLGVLVGATAVVIGVRHPRPEVRRVVRESLLVLTGAVLLQVVAGVVLDARQEALVERVPALLGLVPPFIATCGSLGGMLASRLSSKLHLGLLEPRAVPDRLAALDVSVTGLLAGMAFTGVGAVGWAGALLVGGAPPPVTVLLGVALVGGAMATVALSLVAYGTATASFRFGFDPDNYGIPIVTATMDLLGILCLVAAVAALGVG